MTTNLPALRDLARRLADATGPDRELDYALMALLPPEEPWPESVTRPERPGLTVEPLPFTGDLQACSELFRVVLPGATGWMVGGSAIEGRSEASVWSRAFGHKNASAPTAPLAWCAAVVAAVMAREGGG